MKKVVDAEFEVVSQEEPPISWGKVLFGLAYNGILVGVAAVMAAREEDPFLRGAAVVCAWFIWPVGAFFASLASRRTVPEHWAQALEERVKGRYRRRGKHERLPSD